MQKSYDIEELPEAVHSGIISAEEGAKIIWRDIYLHPQQYGLLYFSEDQKSDFLLETHKLFEKIFDKFIPGLTSFKTYISGCLTNHKKTFLKNQLTRENERRSMDSFLKTKTEEESQKYLVSVAESRLSASEEVTHTKNFSDITANQWENVQKRDKRVADLTALVLMMKACTDVDDDTISAVSDFTKINKTLLYDKIQELKQTMDRRERNHQKLVQRRNNAFFFHRKYMQEMISPDSTEKKVKILKEKYDGQTKKWESNNKTLALHSNSPSNEEIAKTIGIKPRMVSFYINNARNDKRRKRIQNLYQSQQKKKNEKEDRAAENNGDIEKSDKKQ